MPRTNPSQARRQRRKIGIRKRIFGSSERPRLSIFRSGKHVYAQIINDDQGRTLASASSLGSAEGKGYNQDGAASVGRKIAEQAAAAGVSEVAFDRNGFRYHGRVKALADAAREAGLRF